MVQRPVARCRAPAPRRSRRAHRRAPAPPRRAAPCPAPGRSRSRWPACSRCRACGAWRCAVPANASVAVARRQQVDHRRRPADGRPSAAPPARPARSSASAARRIAVEVAGSPARSAPRPRAGSASARRRSGSRRRTQRGDRVGRQQRARRPWPPSPDRPPAARRRQRRQRVARPPSIVAASPSMPVLIASAPISSSTTAIWRATKSGGTGMHAVHAQRVLRGQRGDRGRGVAAERGDRLDVGLDAGAAAGIRSGDRPAPGRRISAGIQSPAAARWRVTAAISAHRSSTTRPTSASSSASAITRTNGSVPLSRISSAAGAVQPRLGRADRLHGSARRRSGEAPAKRTLLQQLRQRREHAAHLAGRAGPARRAPPAPAARPPGRRRWWRSRTGSGGRTARRRHSCRPRASARPRSGRRRGCGAVPGRARARKRSRPRLDITVATMPPPRSVPACDQDRADQRQHLVAVDQVAALVGHQQRGRRRRPARCPDRRRAPAPARTGIPARWSRSRG